MIAVKSGVSFDFVGDEESVVEVARVVEFVCNVPGSLGGVRVGHRAEDLEQLGFSADADLYFGSEEAPEAPEIPYEDEEWAADWHAITTHDAFASIIDGAVAELSYRIRGLTPIDDWAGAPPQNQRLHQLRDAIIKALTESLEQTPRGAPSAKFFVDGSVIDVKPIARQECFEPWLLLELEVYIEQHDEASEEAGSTSDGSAEELQAIADAIDCPDAFDAYCPVTRVERSTEGDVLEFRAFFTAPNGEEYTATLAWDATHDVLDAQGSPRDVLVQAFITELGHEFARADEDGAFD